MCLRLGSVILGQMRFEGLLDRRTLLASVLTSAATSGCLIDRAPLAFDAVADAWVDPSVDAFVPGDAGNDADLDARLDPSIDAWSPDAFASPDAFQPVDAFTRVDAGCMPRCALDGLTLMPCDGPPRMCEGACGTSVSNPEPHCLVLEPANVPAMVDVRGASATITVGANATWDTGHCDAMGLPGVPMDHIHKIRGTGDEDLCIVRALAFRLEAGVRLQAVGRRPLVIVSPTSITIEAGATLSVASVTPPDCRVPVAGAGAGAGARTGGTPGGEGMAATGDTGGGGGGFCGPGGDGGEGNGGRRGGEGGEAVDFPSMTPLVGGASGGRGSPMASGGVGGPGGGALQLSAPSLVIYGNVLAHGAGGLGGRYPGSDAGSGGGGGSGGAVLLEAIRLVSTGYIDVRGGGGGGGACNSGDSPHGACAASSTVPALMSGGAPGTCSSVGFGGDGASGEFLDGSSGQDAFNGGGGGGGAGCVALRVYESGSVWTAPSAPGVLSTGMPSVR